MENILNETKFLMKKYKISANKSLGQNFLINDEAVDDIVSSSKICSDDLVIEIGPGLGTLTKELLEKAAKVIAIELDTRMIKILNDRFSLYNNFEIINEDVLKVDLEKLISDQKNNLPQIKNVKIVANLPYYITTPIIEKIIEDDLGVDKIVIMVQKEVGDRFNAKVGTKDYNSLTVFLNYYFDIKKLMNVSRNSFVPAPNVDSVIIEMDKKKNNYAVENEKLFFNIIRDSFKFKRKNLRNNLKGYNLDKILEVLKEYDLDLTVRAENLTIEQFIEISNKLNEE